jgi:hypothetical protein
MTTRSRQTRGFSLVEVMVASVLMIIAVALYPVRLGFYFLTYRWLGADAIWWSFTVGSIAGLALGWWFYRYSNWRRHALAEAPEEAREQVQADGEPAGRMVPDV